MSNRLSYKRILFQLGLPHTDYSYSEAIDYTCTLGDLFYMTYSKIAHMHVCTYVWRKLYLAKQK